MKVYKFGGASVKNATSIINVAKILKSEENKDILIVISAMGKMTNAFEKIVQLYTDKNRLYLDRIEDVNAYHFSILKELFIKSNPVFGVVNDIFQELRLFLKTNNNLNYDYVYDQVVSFGELLSTHIVSNYLNSIGQEVKWLDARELIRTNNDYRDAIVDWNDSQRRIRKAVLPNKVYMTQGFIAGYGKTTTTLGREGSDYSAAIFAYSLDAESLTIWKDVDGVLNADPRYFKKTKLLNQMSYSEALEMAFYGASVIHPKTIKPLENKMIPLFVRSFLNTDMGGTIINKGFELVPKVPCYTIKENQTLISISAKDFSFMIEHNISHIFQLFSKHRIHVNLIQNSAISFSVCVDDLYCQLDQLLKELKDTYNATYNQNVKLLSIRHFDTESLNETKKYNKVLLIQQSRETVQFVMQ